MKNKRQQTPLNRRVLFDLTISLIKSLCVEICPEYMLDLIHGQYYRDVTKMSIYKRIGQESGLYFLHSENAWHQLTNFAL